MKIGWITDLHIHEKNYRRLSVVFSKIKETFAKNKVDIIVSTGDTFHIKNILKVTDIVFFNELLDELTKIAPVFSIVGNHDWAKVGCYEESSLLPFSNKKGHTVINKSMLIKDEKGNNIWLMAHFWDLARMKNVMSEAPKSIDMLFGHLDISGFDLGHGAESSGTILSPESLEDIGMVFSGHYHKMQKNKNIVYLGTQYTQDRSECGEKKYFGIIDSSNGKLELFEGETFHQRISIPASSWGSVNWQKSRPEDELILEVIGSKKELDEVRLPSGSDVILVKKEEQSRQVRLDLSLTMNDSEIIRRYVKHKKGNEDEEIVNFGLNALSSK